METKKSFELAKIGLVTRSQHRRGSETPFRNTLTVVDGAVGLVAVRVHNKPALQHVRLRLGDGIVVVGVRFVREVHVVGLFREVELPLSHWASCAPPPACADSQRVIF